jgi:hypothetical protein
MAAKAASAAGSAGAARAGRAQKTKARRAVPRGDFVFISNPPQVEDEFILFSAIS